MEEEAATAAAAALHLHDEGEEDEQQEEDDEAEQAEEQQVVYCAVGEIGNGKQEEWKANLQWVLANVPRSKRLVLAHLRRLPSRINMMGAWVPVSQLAEEEVTAYKQLEEDKIGKVLDDLLHICKSQKVNASKIIVARDDTARGIVQLVDDHGVTELVMGAASDRAYTRKMRAPRSKKALTVQRKANPSCKIWFVCKGNLICTRESSEGPHKAESSTSSTSPRSSTSEGSRSKSLPRVHSETLFSTQEPNDPTGTSSVVGETRTSRWGNAMEDSNHQASMTEIVESAEEPETPADEQLLHEVQEDQQGAPSPDGSEGGGEMMMDGALYEKLKDAVMEAENLRREAYEETRRRQMAERELAEASKMADEAERWYRREANHRREMEQMLSRERAAMEQDSQELHDILDKVHEVDGRSAELEVQITRSERVMHDLQARVSESYYGLLDALKGSDDADADQDQGVAPPPTTTATTTTTTTSSSSLFLRRLGYWELDEATKHFDESARIDGGGGGGRGKVYRAELGNMAAMAVAVKVLRRDVAVDEARFGGAVERMSRAVARHPNLVAVVGACPEARAVAYELVPGGSLEEHLAGGGVALPWRARCGVAYAACSALAFLHARGVVHGDVRPANILLVGAGGSSSCKLAGLGTRGLVATGGVARAALAYAHPQCLAATGEMMSLTPRCDVYALGVVLLRLATGMPPFLATKAAREAAGGARDWRDVVDACWPPERGRKVAMLGLRCCDDDTDGGGAGVMRRVLEKEARGVLLLDDEESESESGDGAPPYLMCPILKEVMREPMIAGDGFTYEAEAIREWLGTGHDTSPMTNLKLPTPNKLVPNHPLRSAIQQWSKAKQSNANFDTII